MGELQEIEMRAHKQIMRAHAQIQESNTALSNERAKSGSLARSNILQLQHAIGNRAVGKLLSRVVQRQMPEEEEEITAGQAKFQSRLIHTVQAKPEASEYETGLPDHLKSGLENLSNLDLSSVRVHYNSSKPAQLNALAYTQGEQIYVGHGQEKHLAHEGWHAVQQIQGRVNSTTHMKGESINDDAGLEREAEVMGAKALQMPRAEQATTSHSRAIQKKGNVAQLVAPAIIAGLGAAEWIALGAAGYVVASDAVNSASGDISYIFDEMEGVLLPGGGNDVPAYRTAHPNTTINEATHHVAVWFGMPNDRKMGIKFGITFLYDGHALGNISLSIIDTYDWPGWAGNVNVNITPRSLAAGGTSSVRFTINMGTNNSWFVEDFSGNLMFLLRADGDLSLTSSSAPHYHIG